MGRPQKTIRRFKDNTKKSKCPYTDIDGKKISEERRIGYCHNKIHKGYLSHEQIVDHKCFKKNCPYFNKYEEHPYWVKKAEKNALKKERKKALQESKEAEEILREIGVPFLPDGTPIGID